MDKQKARLSVTQSEMATKEPKEQPWGMAMDLQKAWLSEK
jgi:hypothetical protein